MTVKKLIHESDRPEESLDMHNKFDAHYYIGSKHLALPVSLALLLEWLVRDCQPQERELALAGKLTGRQLFLKDATLNLSDVALIEQSVEIDESLFDEEIDGLDIDSDED
ncbi:hypothetical protein TELCIR_08298 [Teladorsagia circumcincta]|uniref:Uncharacterized protein n=1 Tax=Teladorsagia circumcincta TaxID=45464 RepID=A0A2G9UI52_TELCI|nr:hypothetical protein TELCIR_08298 [Teladorsagia circumcincta]